MFDASKLLGVSLKSGEWLHFKKKAGDVSKEQLGTKTQTTYFTS